MDIGNINKAKLIAQWILEITDILMYNVYPFEMCDTKKNARLRRANFFAPPNRPKFDPTALKLHSLKYLMTAILY